MAPDMSSAQTGCSVYEPSVKQQQISDFSEDEELEKKNANWESLKRNHLNCRRQCVWNWKFILMVVN